MLHRRVVIPVLLLFLAVLVTPVALGAKKKAEEPDRVVVQHCLIGFKRSIPGKKLDRTKKEAGELAAQILERARNGEPFDGLVKEYTGDSVPGIYVLANEGLPIRSGERQRGDMVPGFGDTAFRLEVGEYGMVPYHGYKSPYGWHIILRLE